MFFLLRLFSTDTISDVEKYSFHCPTPPLFTNEPFSSDDLSDDDGFHVPTKNPI